MKAVMSAMHMSSNKSYEVQRSNNFMVQITGLSGGSDLTLAVRDYGLPSINIQPIELPFGNHRVKVAGQPAFEGADSLVVRDFIQKDIEKIIYDWQSKVYDPDSDKIGWAADYKMNGFIYEYAPDGSNVRTWKIIGMWPTDVNYGSTMSYDGSEGKNVEITIAYDKAQRV